MINHKIKWLETIFNAILAHYMLIYFFNFLTLLFLFIFIFLISDCSTYHHYITYLHLELPSFWVVHIGPPDLSI
jgi:hypothetical protein